MARHLQHPWKEFPLPARLSLTYCGTPPKHRPHPQKTVLLFSWKWAVTLLRPVCFCWHTGRKLLLFSWKWSSPTGDCCSLAESGAVTLLRPVCFCWHTSRKLLLFSWKWSSSTGDCCSLAESGAVTLIRPVCFCWHTGRKLLLFSWKWAVTLLRPVFLFLLTHPAGNCCSLAESEQSLC